MGFLDLFFGIIGNHYDELDVQQTEGSVNGHNDRIVGMLVNLSRDRHEAPELLATSFAFDLYRGGSYINHASRVSRFLRRSGHPQLVLCGYRIVGAVIVHSWGQNAPGFVACLRGRMGDVRG
jgi:hypothetical protein